MKYLQAHHIFPSDSDDAEDIVRIHKNAYNISYRGYLPDEYIDKRVEDNTRVARTKEYVKDHEFWLALIDDYPIGFATVTYPEVDTFEIQSLYVDPKYQKNGAGSALINHLLNTKKLQRCILWTMKFGPSLGFYKKMGFTATGNKKPWAVSDVIIFELEKIL